MSQPGRSDRSPGTGKRWPSREASWPETTWPGSGPCSRGATGRSGGLDVRLVEVVVDGLLRDAERAADADRGQLTRVHQAVDGHLAHPHRRRDLGNGQEPDLGKRSLGWAHRNTGPSRSHLGIARSLNAASLLAAGPTYPFRYARPAQPSDDARR